MPKATSLPPAVPPHLAPLGDPTHTCPRCAGVCRCEKGATTPGPLDPKTGRHPEVVVCEHNCQGAT
jgi:hypothetical protein